MGRTLQRKKHGVELPWACGFVHSKLLSDRPDFRFWGLWICCG